MPKEVSYGDKRRPWNTAFVEYMNMIVDHPNYAGMPGARDDTGKIDWTIPSNRPRGSKNWDGNARRRAWWEARARSLEIAIEGQWLSKTAKAIHPTKTKPCQTCGRVMELSYVYPTVITIAKLNAYLPDAEKLEHGDYLSIYEVVDHFFTELGEEAARAALAKLFSQANHASTPADFKEAMRTQYAEKEARKFSPGAMSNAPDRLDGFHTYNLCCRSRQDTGRDRQNLRSYGVDRRAFEQWCEGDWASADFLMSQVGVGPCAECGSVEQLSADHIGPISLGFAHSPNFRPLCNSCNSGKNNRMSHRDVQDLVEREASGEAVVSWQARPLWDLCKHAVGDDPKALLLSKLMRISQHHYLESLYLATQAGVPDCLMQFLHPEHAYSKPVFHDLDPATLRYSSLERLPRHDTYARMKAARMVRIAFEALKEYAAKSKRNVQVVADDLVRDYKHAFLDAVELAAAETSALREPLVEILQSDEGPDTKDNKIALLMTEGDFRCAADARIRATLQDLMEAYARTLFSRFERGENVSWDDLADL
jgi:Alw26I/Eco31I/Esp3I family type II restriction endonuclease